jgi:hypothetical protein
MCKAAENERIKLKATFYNNIAVGLIVAGALLPYLALIQKVSELNGRLHLDPDGYKIGFVALGFGVALWCSWRFRRAANTEIAKLQD